MLGKCAIDNSNTTIRVLLLIERVDGIGTLGRFCLGLGLTDMVVDWTCVGEEGASGLFLYFNPAGGGVRVSENSTLNGDGLSRALNGTGNSSSPTGEKERLGTCISGRVGGVDEIRPWSNKTGVGRSTSLSSS
jgi:hypothetical protein